MPRNQAMVRPTVTQDAKMTMTAGPFRERYGLAAGGFRVWPGACLG